MPFFLGLLAKNIYLSHPGFSEYTRGTLNLRSAFCFWSPWDFEPLLNRLAFGMGLQAGEGEKGKSKALSLVCLVPYALKEYTRGTLNLRSALFFWGGLLAKNICLSHPGFSGYTRGTFNLRSAFFLLALTTPSTKNRYTWGKEISNRSSDLHHTAIRSRSDQVAQVGLCEVWEKEREMCGMWSQSNLGQLPWTCKRSTSPQPGGGI